MKTRQLILISFSTALLVISGWISVPLPFSSVPLSLQSLWLMILALSLPLNLSLWAVGLYLLMGLVGIPVFANGHAGLSALVGPTGGYLLGFFFAVPVIHAIQERWPGLFGTGFAGFLGGIGVIYLFGVTWLAFVLNQTVVHAFVIGAIPFLPLDIVKVLIAIAIAPRLKRVMLRLAV